MTVAAMPVMIVDRKGIPPERLSLPKAGGRSPSRAIE